MDAQLRRHARDARDQVRAGHLRGPALRELLHTVPFDQRDLWLDELLSLPELPVDLPGLPSGTVPYLPCELDVILRAVDEAPLAGSDVFVDLGAGLGRPALLAHLLSGARAIGVELQSHLCAEARHAASQLGLDVTFLVADAAEVAPEGDVFFIYSSFNGAALTRVLARLQAIAARRRIVLCAVDFEVNVPWLAPRRSRRPELVFYDSK
jgi:SAM-dependent methyltransferase